MRQFIFAISLLVLTTASPAYAQEAESIDEIIAKGTIQTDPAMSAWNAGDYATAEVEFQKNNLCALRRERNFQYAAERARESSTDSTLASDVSATLGRAATGGSRGPSSGNSLGQRSLNARVNSSNFKDDISATKRTCEDRGFQIYMLGLSQLKLGKRADAKRSLRRAAAMRSSLFDAHFRLSLLDYQDGDIESANKHFKKLKKLESKYKKGEAKNEIKAQIAYLGSLLG